MDSKKLGLIWMLVSLVYGVIVAFVYDATWFVFGFAVLLGLGWVAIGVVGRNKS